ncbi:MAG: beta-1,6-N-acetylglucosaminyltransferase [Lachnospiraceae bacterium]|nr:beta-1,6-N-acetylglucosaminyltransferase [Lachnospiraceae bacterium]
MKHAYMIMAHNQKELLGVLLELLDCENNDLYIHIDAKSDMDTDDLKSFVKKAGIHVYKEFKIYWADISQTKCQFFLLREATKTYHDYYHLISGSDLPLKTNAQIDEFFEGIRGKQLINFDSETASTNRNCAYWHFCRFLMSKAARGKDHVHSKGYERLRKLDRVLVDIQVKLGVKTGLSRGCNWNSITHELAEDYIRHEEKILKKTHFALSSDESVLQTYVRLYGKGKWQIYNEKSHDYEDTVFRKIDWVRGYPYVWQIGDYDELMSSGMLFARKFDIDKDKEIIYKIRDTLKAGV